MKKLTSKIHFSPLLLRLILGLIMFVLYMLIAYLYRVNISPRYLYSGFTHQSLNLFKFIFSVIFFIAPVMILSLYPKRPSDYTVWVLYLFSYAPTALLSFHIINRGITEIISLLLMLLTAFLIFFYSRLLIVKILPKIKINFEKIDIVFLILLFIILAFYVLSLIGYKLTLDVSTIYARRLAVRETLVPKSISAYILWFTRQCMLLIGVYLGVAKKKPYYLVMTAILAIGLFSFDGTKTSIIIPLVLVVLAWLLITNPNRNVLFLPISLLIVSFIGLAEFLFFHTYLVNDYIVRRIFIVPGVLNSFYWDFFSVNPKGMLAGSIFSKFLTPVYDMPITFVIGREYLHNIQTNANTGIWMGWYAHFGILGVFAASAIGGFIVGLIDRLTKSGLYIFGCLVCFLIGITWSEQMLHTSMLTGGIIYYIIILLFINISPRLRKFWVYQSNKTNDSMLGEKAKK